MITEYKKFENMEENTTWVIHYGLGGGFGGARDCEIVEDMTEDAAITYAWEKSCQEYDMYDGLHGLRSVGDIMEEDELEEEDAMQQWEQERENWLDYWVEPYDPIKHKDIECGS